MRVSAELWNTVSHGAKVVEFDLTNFTVGVQNRKIYNHQDLLEMYLHASQF